MPKTKRSINHSPTNVNPYLINEEKKEEKVLKQTEEEEKKDLEQQRKRLQRQEYLQKIKQERYKIKHLYGDRETVNSNRICNDAANLNAYIQSILNCLDKLLERLNKRVEIITNKDGSITYYIPDDTLTKEELIEYRQYFPQFIGEIPKATLVENETLPEKDKYISEHLTKMKELRKLDILLQHIFIAWVNGERGGDPLMGTISLLYGILQSMLKTPNIMFGILDDDSDSKKSYQIFGFKHLNPSNPNEASADFTNIEKIIDNVINLISTKYPDIASCFQQARVIFNSCKSTRSSGGKRRTKKRKSKRRKTRRRRKY